MPKNLRALKLGGIMRNADQRCVNGHMLICIDEPELQFYLGLLTRLKADDLVSEDDRVSAIRQLTLVLARVRDVTKSQSPATEGDTFSQ